MGILPLKPIIHDLLKNIWHLRTVLGALELFLVASGIALYVIEELVFGNSAHGALFWIEISFDDVIPPTLAKEISTSIFSMWVRKLNGLAGYLLLGLIVWVVQRSISGHNLKASRFVFFATNQDAQD